MANHCARRWLPFLLLVFLLPQLTACEWIDRRDVEGVAKRFVRAAADGDYAALRKMAYENKSYEYAKDLVEEEFGTIDVRRRLDGLTLKTVYLDKENATVEAVGTLRYSMPFIAATKPVELEIKLIKQKGTWYVQDVDAL